MFGHLSNVFPKPKDNVNFTLYKYLILFLQADDFIIRNSWFIVSLACSPNHEN